MVRAFVDPLERLTATSRAFAAGDLSARSGIRRKDEVGELARALDDMAGRLEERIRNEKELFANISHKIRIPLARLRVVLELCEVAPVDAQQTLEQLQGSGLGRTGALGGPCLDQRPPGSCRQRAGGHSSAAQSDRPQRVFYRSDSPLFPSSPLPMLGTTAPAGIADDHGRPGVAQPSLRQPAR